MGVAGFGSFGDGGAAGVGEAEDFGYFVEAFSYGVVAGGGYYFEGGVGGYFYYLGVASGDY